MKWLLPILLSAAPALAQPADCPATPVGPSLPLGAGVGMAGHSTAWLDLGAVPANGTACAADAPPPTDVLHGNGPADVLHNRPTGHVFLQPLPPDHPKSP